MHRRPGVFLSSLFVSAAALGVLIGCDSVTTPTLPPLVPAPPNIPLQTYDSNKFATIEAQGQAGCVANPKADSIRVRVQMTPNSTYRLDDEGRSITVGNTTNDILVGPRVSPIPTDPAKNETRMVFIQKDGPPITAVHPDGAATYDVFVSCLRSTTSSRQLQGIVV